MPDAWRRVLRFDVRNVEDWLVLGLRVWLVCGAVWYLARPVVLTYVPGPYLAAVTIAGVLAGGLLGSLAGPRPRLARAAEAAWLALFLLHFLGHSADLYRVMPGYDLGVHFVGGALGALVVLALGLGTRLLWDRPTPFRMLAAVLGFVALGGVTVELVEYAADATVGTTEQTDAFQAGMDDTMTDIAASTSASILVGVAGSVLGGRGVAVGPGVAGRGRVRAEA